MWDEGIFTSPAVPPGVPDGQCIVRTSITARHSHDDIEEILFAFERVGKSLDVI
jgi:7-keto-8-aminopelargonate synthetase-like enzyme